MNKKIPTFKTDEEAISFLEQDDLSDYITSENFVPARVIFNQPRFEELPKTENVHLRCSKPLLDAIKQKASSQGVHYQRYIRRILESSLDPNQRHL